MAAIVIACSGTYGEILNFEVTVDFIFFAMTAAALFIIRRRQTESDVSDVYRTPGHPFTTAIFVFSCLGIVVSAVIGSPRNSAVALCIMLAALPTYYFWTRLRGAHS
jgi:APA family basic amino acid/polyamine antiporter